MDTRRHILSTFNEALTKLKETTLKMGADTSRNLDNSVRGLLERKYDLCNQAIADDDDEDQLEVEIDHMGMELIVKFRPLAGDLRMVIASMKIAVNLERISDQAVSIAKRARKILKKSGISKVNGIEPLYFSAANLVRQSMTPYSDGNIKLAIKVTKDVEKHKQLYKKTSRVFTKALEAEDPNYMNYLDLVFI